jgi:hypothetical protein
VLLFDIVDMGRDAQAAVLFVCLRIMVPVVLGLALVLCRGFARVIGMMLRSGALICWRSLAVDG